MVAVMLAVVAVVVVMAQSGLSEMPCSFISIKAQYSLFTLVDAIRGTAPMSPIDQTLSLATSFL